MAMFTGKPDAFIIEKVDTSIGILTGTIKPVTKSAEQDPEMWLKEMAFLHCMILVNAFDEGQRRGILSPDQIRMAGNLIVMM